MPISKINYGEKTLMDLTEDTVTPETLLEGVTAHDKTGTSITGNVKISEIDAELSETSENPVQNKVVNAAISDVISSTIPAKHIIQSSEDADDAITLYSLETGIYLLKGRFRPYDGAEKVYVFTKANSGIAFVTNNGMITIVHTIYPNTNKIWEYTISMTGIDTYKCIEQSGTFSYAENKKFKVTSMNPNDSMNNQNYPSVKAVYDALTSYLALSGGTLTGALTLSGEPTEDLHAATKKYVDDTKTSIVMKTWTSSDTN